jgi:NADH-quinone oxidoreductase subunit L
MGSVEYIPTLLGIAVLLPLFSFGIIVLFGPKMGPHGKFAAYVASAAIGSGFVLSLFALAIWLNRYGLPEVHAAEESHAEHANVGAAPREAKFIARSEMSTISESSAAGAHEDAHAHVVPPPSTSGQWWPIYESGDLDLSIGYYVDALTVIMFCMVTLIASCVHVYAMGYMHDELHDVTDHEVTPLQLVLTSNVRAGITASSNTCRCSASACWGWSSPATCSWSLSSGSWWGSVRTS